MHVILLVGIYLERIGGLWIHHMPYRGVHPEEFGRIRLDCLYSRHLVEVHNNGRLGVEVRRIARCFARGDEEVV